MKLIVGLGNPGEKHARNRHNVGFMAVEELARLYGFDPWRKKFAGQLAEGRIGSQKCLMLKPATFMNLSGRSVAEAARFFKLDPVDVIVIYDEIDLAPGKLKVKTGGGNAGHNGLRSISPAIGNGYVRVRIGVGRPANKAQVSGYVLRDFSKADQDWLVPLIDAIAACAPKLIDDDAAGFMTDISLRLGPADDAAGPEKTKAKPRPRKSTTPSPRDLARRAASSSASDSPEGPLADKLKNWLKPKPGDE